MDDKEKPVQTGSGHVSRSRHNPGNLMIGLVLLLVGITYLLRNLGIADVTNWVNWGIFWPLLIVLLGLLILTGRGVASSIVSFIVVGLVLSVIIIAALSGASWQDVSNRSESVRIFDWGNRDVQKHDLSIEKDAGIGKAEVSIDAGAGNLTVAGGGNKLVTGTLESKFLQLSTKTRTDGSTQRVTVKTQGSSRFSLGNQTNDLSVSLNENTPMDLIFNTGAMDMDIDLSRVMAETVDIDTGASKLNLTMGDKVVNSRVKIDAGASKVVIELPRTLGAKLDITSGLTSKTLTDFIQKDSDTYESANYESASRKVELELELGASSLEINWR